MPDVTQKNDGLLDTVKKYLANPLPPPHKAIILLPKERVYKQNSISGTVNQASDQQLEARGGGLNAEERQKRDAMEEALRKNAETEIKSISDMTAAKDTIANNAGYKVLRVHYNPSSIGFRGAGGESIRMSSGMGNMSENQIQQMKVDISTTMYCQLVFADIDNHDAFFYNNMEGGAAWMAIGAIESLATLISNKVGATNFLNKSHSVQKYVDGLIAALIQSYTRQIMFCWGNNIFRGQLTRVNGTYKMFNTRGEPILATVDLEIRQDADKDYDEKFWRKQFVKVFEKTE